MASTTKGTDVPAATAPIPAHVVGNAFVQQYYRLQHESPNEVYKFYQENSRLARPSAAGGGVGMDSVTTIEAIKKKIMEMDAAVKTTEINIDTVDSHSTPGGGVIVIVKGRTTNITSPGDGQSRGFSQSFLLVPQESGGYYVHEDTLRYVG